MSVNSGGYLPRRSGSVNIHRYSPPLRRIIVNYQLDINHFYLCAPSIAIFISQSPQIFASSLSVFVEWFPLPATTQQEMAHWSIVSWAHRTALPQSLRAKTKWLLPAEWATFISAVDFRLQSALSMANIALEWNLSWFSSDGEVSCSSEVRANDGNERFWSRSLKTCFVCALTSLERCGRKTWKLKASWGNLVILKRSAFRFEGELICNFSCR